MKKTLMWALYSLVPTFTLVSCLVSCNVIWTSPGYFEPSVLVVSTDDIMNMEEYEKVSDHPRPYCFTIKTKGKGEVHVLGLTHTKDTGDPQLDTVRARWKNAKPSVALVEGRLGFLFAWTQNPVEKFGEGGLVAQLARSGKARLYTWEPSRKDEIAILLNKHDAKKLAMFYSLRPYFSNMRNGKPSDPEKQLQEYIEDRTDYDGIRGQISSWKEIDAIWKKDFPNEKDWRGFSDEHGWPPGYLAAIHNDSNLTRDVHLCSILADLFNKNEIVFVSMGSSHAVRIEAALRKKLGN